MLRRPPPSSPSPTHASTGAAPIGDLSVPFDDATPTPGTLLARGSRHSRRPLCTAALGTLAVALLLPVMGCHDEFGSAAHDLQIDENTRFLINDQLGSASLVLDAAGRVVSRTANKPWGETWFAWNAADEKAPTYRFTGKPDDRIASTVSIGVRNYLPALGRWTSPDPRYLFEDPAAAADPNSDRGLFRYAKNRPTDLVDPDGRDVEEVGVTVGVELMGFSGSLSIGLAVGDDGSVGVAMTASRGLATTPLGASAAGYFQKTLHQDIRSAAADSVNEFAASGGELMTVNHATILQADSEGNTTGYVGSRTEVGAGVGMTPVTLTTSKPTTMYVELDVPKPVKPRRGDLGMIGNIYWKSIRPMMDKVGM